MAIHEKTGEARSPTPVRETFRGGHILIVDDEPLIQDILVRTLSGLGYDCEACGSGEDALRRLQSRDYELMLADIMMPGMEGQTLLSEALRICPDLAVILVTGVSDIGVAVNSIKHGACDYVTKPFLLNDLAVSVRRALERRRLRIENRLYRQTLEDQVAGRTQQLKEALDTLRHNYHSTLQALGTALDSREAGSTGHSLRIMKYAARIAREMCLDDSLARSMEQAALLHDVGKIGVPDRLLLKPGPLTEHEWAVMRRHPEIGFRILSGIRFLSQASEIVLHHQERYDGTGYPGALRGEQIALGARVIAVADTLECMTSDRPFQRATSFEAAQEEITRVAGSQLDPWIVDSFLRVPLDEFQAMRDDIALLRAPKLPQVL